MSKKAKSGEEGQTVKVMLRVRPLVRREKEAGHSTKRIGYEGTDKINIESANDRGKKSFSFHEVFQPSVNNNHVYNSFAKDTVEAAFQGFHGVMFVYGQTASGKTHTISNDAKDDLGMLQQSMFHVWDRIQNDKDSTYNCKLTYVEIYNEHVTDLLAESEATRNIRLQTANLGEVLMITEAGDPIGTQVQSYQDCMKCFTKGQNSKAVAATSMNDRSSRSHTIFSLDIEKSTRVVDPQSGESKSLTALKGRLVICDLAGSERASKTKAEGATLREAANINGSLLVLGNVVSALIDKKGPRPPFRESKLTRILQYSLSGHGKTSIIVTISPSDDNTEESISAIGFGQRAIQIKQSAQKHEVRDYQALYLSLQAELDRRVDDGIEAAVAEEKLKAEQTIEDHLAKLKVLEAENALLINENAELRKGNPSAVHRDPAAGLAVKSQSTKDLLKAASETSGFQAAEWNKIVQGLIAKVKEQADALAKSNAEGHRLREDVKKESNKVFGLGLRYRDLIEETVIGRREKEAELQELRQKLSSLQGTQYLAPTLPQEEEEERRKSPAVELAMPDSPSAASGSGFGMSPRIMEELTKAQDEASSLKQDVAELQVYQRLAADAIRMLYHDNVRLGGRIGQRK